MRNPAGAVAASPIAENTRGTVGFGHRRSTAATRTRIGSIWRPRKLCPYSKLLAQPCPLARLQRSCWVCPRSHPGAVSPSRRSSWVRRIQAKATRDDAASTAAASTVDPIAARERPAASITARPLADSTGARLGGSDSRRFLEPQLFDRDFAHLELLDLARHRH